MSEIRMMSKNGQSKCVKCGATDISTNANTGSLRCNYCKYEWNTEKVNNEVDENLFNGFINVSAGAKDIRHDAPDIITLKCRSCGAEVVINTADQLQARCHWCRNTLSINDQISNGAVPDMVLPFAVSKEEAQGLMKRYYKKRKLLANRRFKKEFTIENICPMYYPYMLVDVKSHAYFHGQGEIQTAMHSRKGNIKFYDANAFDVERDFDILIKDLTIESSSDKQHVDVNVNSNNIINSILPFDTENCVEFNANYLKNATSEKRDTNVSDIEMLVKRQADDIAKYEASNVVQYDRGIRYDAGMVNVENVNYKTAYLPVWLYSYMDENNMNHFMAVNARTRETAGSIPASRFKLLIASLISAILLNLFFYIACQGFYFMGIIYGLIFAGIVYGYLNRRYRNLNLRHYHESETKRYVSNMIQHDYFVESRYNMLNSKIQGCNSDVVSGSLSSYNNTLSGSFYNYIDERYVNKGISSINDFLGK